MTTNELVSGWLLNSCVWSYLCENNAFLKTRTDGETIDDDPRVYSNNTQKSLDEEETKSQQIKMM